VSGCKIIKVEMRRKITIVESNARSMEMNEPEGAQRVEDPY
jgi:hypothetical protein